MYTYVSPPKRKRFYCLKSEKAWTAIASMQLFAMLSETTRTLALASKVQIDLGNQEQKRVHAFRLYIARKREEKREIVD